MSREFRDSGRGLLFPENTTFFSNQGHRVSVGRDEGLVLPTLTYMSADYFLRFPDLLKPSVVHVGRLNFCDFQI